MNRIDMTIIENISNIEKLMNNPSSKYYIDTQEVKNKIYQIFNDNQKDSIKELKHYFNFDLSIVYNKELNEPVWKLDIGYNRNLSLYNNTENLSESSLEKFASISIYKRFFDYTYDHYTKENYPYVDNIPNLLESIYKIILNSCKTYDEDINCLNDRIKNHDNVSDENKSIIYSNCKIIEKELNTILELIRNSFYSKELEVIGEYKFKTLYLGSIKSFLNERRIVFGG